jgi:hypothetical protein
MLGKSETNKAEISTIIAISLLMSSFSGILIAKRKKTISGTGSRVIRGKEAVQLGLSNAFLMALMALLLLCGLVALK